MLTANPAHIPRRSSPTSDNSDMADLEAIATRIRALERVLAANASTARPHVSETTTTTTTTTTTSQAIPESAEGTGAEDSNNSNTIPTSPTAQPAAPVTAAGLRTSVLAKNSSVPAPGSLSRRIQKMETLLQNATRERKTIEQFLQKYEESKLAPTLGSSHSDRELLSIQAKIELVLAAQGDLQALAEHAKAIESLQSCAELGGLKNLEPEYPALAKLSTVHVEQSKDQEQVADRVNNVMDEYNSL
ncbi:hypothetical protein BGZ73_001935, partial [Actinomortierella ambigua]